jgi:hypothetical protein
MIFYRVGRRMMLASGLGLGLNLVTYGKPSVAVVASV